MAARIMLRSWRERARQLKRLLSALYIAYRDPRTPLLARIVAICVVAYAVSPIDLIPDPIPVLGYLDDLVLLPLGILLAIRLLPDEIWRDAREAAPARIPVNRTAGAIIVLIWIAVVGSVILFIWRRA